MAFGIDFYILSLFYHHPLVAEEGGYLDRPCYDQVLHLAIRTPLSTVPNNHHNY